MREYAIAPAGTTGLALNTVNDCTNWRISRWCPARNLIKNPSLEYIDPAGTTPTTRYLKGWAARTPGGGNQIIRRLGSTYSGTYAGYAFSSGAAFPGVTYDLTYLISGNLGKTYTLSVAVKPDVAQLITLSVIASAGSSRVIGTVTREIVCGWERLEITFPIPNTSDYGTTPTTLSFEITTNVLGAFLFDAAMLVEGTRQNMVYFDGDTRGAWLSTPGNSYSDLDDKTAGGELVDLRDLGFVVTAYSGLGLPAPEHTGRESAVNGGKSYERTLTRARQFSLTGRIYGHGGVNGIHASRADIIDMLRPSNGDRFMRDVIIEYQPCDPDGAMCCKRRISAKLVDDGLRGNIDNANSELVTLTFEDLNPPGVVEDSMGSADLKYGSAFANHLILMYSPTVGWLAPSASQLGQVLDIASAPEGVYIAIGTTAGGASLIFVDKSGVVTNPSGFPAVATRTSVAIAPNGDIWSGSATPGSYLTYVTPAGTANSAVGSSFNGNINKILFHPNGKIYAAGVFTAPGNHIVVSADYGATWGVLALTGINGTVEDMKVLQDGRIVVVGDFTQAGGVACKNAAIYSPFNATFSPIATSADGRILCAEVGRDGRVYLGGEFSTINGVTCSRIAVWNGTQMQALGAGVVDSGSNAGSVITMAIRDNGELWVAGSFNRAGGLVVQSLAIWNGSTWVPADVGFDTGVTIQASAFLPDGTYFAGFGFEPTTTTGSGATDICYSGSADDRPLITFTGPGRITNLRNVTTGANIYMDYTMQVGEICKLDLRRGSKLGFYSSYYGGKPNAILRGSDLARFALRASASDCKLCPNNRIEVLISGGVLGLTTARMQWDNRHWGIDTDCGSPVIRRTTGGAGIAFSNFKTISGTLTTCNGTVSGQSIHVYDDQGNDQVVTTGAGGVFSVTLPFLASDTFVTAVFNESQSLQWGGVAYSTQLRVLKSDPSTLTFPAFNGTPCCALNLTLNLLTAAGGLIVSPSVTVNITSSGGGAAINVTRAITGPGLLRLLINNPTVQPGTLTITTTVSGYAAPVVSTATFSVCNPITVTQNTFTLNTTTLTGTLRDCNGNPINGATININDSHGINVNVTTNALGVFTSTQGFTPGETIVALATAFSGYNVPAGKLVATTLVIAAVGGTYTFPPFSLSDPAYAIPCPNASSTFGGTLVDCYGTSLVGKTITIVDSAGGSRTVTTTAGGAFTVTGSFAVGTIKAQFSEPATYSTGVSEATLVYPGGAAALPFGAFSPVPCCPTSISGTVTDSLGQAIANANVSITDSAGVTRAVTTGPGGNYSMAAPFAPGSYTGVAYALGHGGSSTISGSFTRCQSHTGNFTGLVRQETYISTFEPIRDCNGFYVTFADVTVTDSLGQAVTTQIGVNGGFTVNFTNMALGPATVVITSPSYTNGPFVATVNVQYYGATWPVINFSPTPCTSATIVSFGLLSSGLRDKFKWPFSAGSIWNTPIGASATLASAGTAFGSYTDPDGNTYPTRLVEEEDYIFMDPSAPTAVVQYSPAEWTGADRCVASGSDPNFPFTVRMPSSYVIPHGPNNNSTAWIDATGSIVLQAQPVARCVAGADATAYSAFGDEDIYGAGRGGAHGGSDLSALGGTIRYGEWTYAKNNNLTYFRHALKVTMMAKKWYYWGGGGGNQWRWPATTADNYASAIRYGGTNSQLKPGSLLALPASFNVAALLTQPGRIIAETLKRFGAYVVDDSYANRFCVSMAVEPAGNVKDEFQALWGYTFRQEPDTTPQETDWFKDMRTIFAALNVVTNNGSSSIGGGGAALSPTAPAIGN
jgi:hypothetical protein